MPHQAFITETFKPYGIEKQAVFLWMQEDQDKFINALRKHGQDWEKVSNETGLSHNVLKAYSKLILKQLDEVTDSSLSDIAEILRSNENSNKQTSSGSLEDSQLSKTE